MTPAYELINRDGYTWAYRLRANGKRSARPAFKVCPRCFKPDKGGGVLCEEGDVEFCSVGCGYVRRTKEAEKGSAE